MIKGSREWFHSPKVPVAEKQAFAKARALAGPNAKFWERFYYWMDRPVLITPDGEVHILYEDKE